MSYLFTFRGYLGRLGFFVNMLILNVMVFIAIAIGGAQPDLQDLIGVLVVAASIPIIAVMIRRCRDLGIPPWVLVIVFIASAIPVVGVYLFGLAMLVLLFAPGWPDQNGARHLFSMAKILAMSDGAIDRTETGLFRSFCDAGIEDERIKDVATAQFAHGALNPFVGFDFYLEKYRKFSGGKAEHTHVAMSLLVNLAEADGTVTATESQLLEKTASALGLNLAEPPGFGDFVGMVAKLAKADGVVGKKEIEVVDHFFRFTMDLSDSERQAAIKKFQIAKDSSTTFEQYAKGFTQIQGGNRVVVESTFGLLMEIAMADEVLSPQEVNYLEQAAKILGIDVDDFDSHRKWNSGEDSTPLGDEAYFANILGLGSEYTMQDIKRQYKSLIAKNHPDKVANLSEAIRTAAHTESKKINEAYDFFKKNFK